jgi:hypothetical protein
MGILKTQMLVPEAVREEAWDRTAFEHGLLERSNKDSVWIVCCFRPQPSQNPHLSSDLVSGPKSDCMLLRVL